MHPGVFAAALHQDVITVPAPGFGKRGVNHGAAVTSALKFRMCYYIFEKAMLPAGTQKIWRRYQHAGCNDPFAYS